ncbi:MAG: hypothetical protein KBC30_02435 [Planctomycetes bacterium]|jgi:response regulator RpfG family c-di-GMP phosphodiesterase|nr:hypothetical protein [Planctomycetota bacterium]HPY75338.1 hypothetical protein [Planctomycetota bacterium]HQA99705.1 hypothetical protein [Planctomycetota bacterium]
MTKDILLIGLENRLPLYQGACEDSEYEYAFHVVGTLPETLSYLKDNTPDVILVDHEAIPDKSMEITQMLKKYPGTQRIPLIFIVNQANIEILLEALYIPVNDYLFLPLDPQEFHIRIKTQCNLLDYKDAKQLMSVDEKIEELQKLLVIFPDYTAARQELSSIYEKTGFIAKALQENLELAQRYYNQHNLGLAMEILSKTKTMLSKQGTYLKAQSPQFAESLKRCMDAFHTMFPESESKTQ